MSLISIILPTFNNMDYLVPCVNSIVLHHTTPGLYEVIIINNGDKGSIPEIHHDNVRVIEAGKNLGWEGGLKLGLEHSKNPFVVFMNDDTYIPASSRPWLLQMMRHFKNPKVAAVGPSSNCVMGLQNAFIHSQGGTISPVNFLIGFCMMVRREALDKVGGVDDSLPYHGDDLDLSIRFRKAGYTMICDKDVFVYHHGFKTGQREFGSAWNSVEMTEKTNMHLIKKHGLKEFWTTINQTMPMIQDTLPKGPDLEGDLIRQYIGEGDVLELGCGGNKTVPHSVGVDIVMQGDLIPDLVATKSVADVQADISKTLPFPQESYDVIVARHILEHIVDTVDVVKDWHRVLRHGGKVIVAVPDEDLAHTIPMDFQHVRAFNSKSLKNQMESLGFKTVAIEDPKNGMSTVGVFQKNGLH